MNENVHAHEIEKFGSMAERWWDLHGEFKTLHAVNPLRIGFNSLHQLKIVKFSMWVAVAAF